MLMQAGGSPTPSPLPVGYTQIELSVTSGRYYIDTGLIAKTNSIYRFVTKAKFNNVNPSFRQLNGNDYNPWWGCDRGSLRYYRVAGQCTPADNTPLVADIWYDMDFTLTTWQSPNRIILYTLNNAGVNVSPNGTFQSYMAYKDFFQIYEDGIQILHLIPCTNPNNVEGMYDTVNQEFHPLISY